MDSEPEILMEITMKICWRAGNLICGIFSTGLICLALLSDGADFKLWRLPPPGELFEPLHRPNGRIAAGHSSDG